MTNSSQGLNAPDSPSRKATENITKKKQAQWPGSDKDLTPQADHGEQSYVGAGKLNNKKALITGGDSGIGRAVAIAYAREGADVAIVYYSEQQDAEETLHWIQEAGSRGLILQADLSDRSECQRVVQQTLSSFGDINILVNNAAVHFECPDITSISEDNLRRTYATNIFAPLWLIQETLPHLKEGDVIINTGSVTGLQGHASLVDYAGTKAAIHNLTQSVAQQLNERGIRVNCVAPGPVWTPLIASTRPEEKVEHFGQSTLWERPAQPAELAPSYVFLASSDSRYYSGKILDPTGR